MSQVTRATPIKHATAGRKYLTKRLLFGRNHPKLPNIYFSEFLLSELAQSDAVMVSEVVKLFNAKYIISPPYSIAKAWSWISRLENKLHRKNSPERFYRTNVPGMLTRDLDLAWKLPYKTGGHYLISAPLALIALKNPLAGLIMQYLYKSEVATADDLFLGTRHMAIKAKQGHEYILAQNIAFNLKSFEKRGWIDHSVRPGHHRHRENKRGPTSKLYRLLQAGRTEVEKYMARELLK